jgi:hypothetical protein
MKELDSYSPTSGGRRTSERLAAKSQLPVPWYEVGEHQCQWDDTTSTFDTLAEYSVDLAGLASRTSGPLQAPADTLVHEIGTRILCAPDHDNTSEVSIIMVAIARAPEPWHYGTASRK